MPLMAIQRHYTKAELEQKRGDFYWTVLEALDARAGQALSVLGAVLEGTAEAVLPEAEETGRGRQRRGASIEMQWLKLQVSTSLSVLRMARMYAISCSATTSSAGMWGCSAGR
jgi:hypothetical protein